MDLLQETKELCRLYRIKPDSAKGQNFLINQAVYDRIVDSAQIAAEDTVMEVGPGLGFLTMALAGRAKQVIAVELDDKLALILPDRLRAQGYQNIKVIHDNILHWPRLNNLPRLDEFKIVANLPYNITAIFLRKFLTGAPKPTAMTLMVQDEVAKRMAAPAGDMSLLSLSTQYYADIDYLFKVPARDFYPAPKVNSAVINLRLKAVDQLPLDQTMEKLLFRLARIGFSARRKMLKKNLANGLKTEVKLIEEAMMSLNISPLARAQDLAVADWLKLLGSLARCMV